MRADPEVASPAAVDDKPSEAATGRSAAITAKIERIRALIVTGEYAVDLDALATRVADGDILSKKPA